MSKSFLVTRPNHDLPTSYLFYWSKSVLKLARQKNIQVIDLSGDKANKKDFTGRMTKINPSFVFLNGHGSEKSVTGQNNQILISVGDNDRLLRGCIVFARSCSSAKKLGPKTISLGTKAFLGYTEPFIFMFDPRASTKPLKDKTAKLFLEPSNKIPTTLLKGHSSSKANIRAKGAFRKNIRKLLTSETKKEDSSVLRFLFWDMRHQVCLGDSKASL